MITCLAPSPGWCQACDGRGDRIRTCDPLLPKQMRYQAAPLPDWRSLTAGRCSEILICRLVLVGGIGVHVYIDVVGTVREILCAIGNRLAGISGGVGDV